MRSGAGGSRGRRNPRPRWSAIIVAVLVVAALVTAVVALDLLRHPGGSGPGSSREKILIPAGTIDSFPGGQFNAEAFIVTANSQVNGTFTTTLGIVVYSMTTTQFESFIRSTTLSAGFQWSSGVLPNNTIEPITVHFGPGSWDLVFLNPNLQLATMVGYLTNLTLSSD